MNMERAAQPINFNAHYTVAGYRGIAWSLRGYDYERHYDCETGEHETVTDETRVIAVMVGDDRKFSFSVDELTLLDDLEYCAECGQVGCRHDGRERV